MELACTVSPVFSARSGGHGALQYLTPGIVRFSLVIEGVKRYNT